MSDHPLSETALEPSHHSRLGDYSTNGRVLLLTVLALAVGCISTVVASGLVWLIRTITNLAFHQRWGTDEATPMGHHLGYWVILVPVAGALIIGLMARFGSPKIRGHGIPEALEAILLSRSMIRLKVAILKPISAAISIGTGGPFGAEGPIIMTGGAFGSLFAQRFHLSASERKTLLAAGAAAGMSAIFDTPIAAVLLAVEVLLFDWKPRIFIPVSVAAMLASSFRTFFFPSAPVFLITPHGIPTGAMLGYAAVVGVAGGLLAGGVTKLVYASEDWFEKIPCHWMWWPAIGAVFIGIGGVIEPRVLGVGYGTIHDLLSGNGVETAVGVLLVAKIVVWTIGLGSGTSGSVLAPLLLIGASLGDLVGHWIPVGDPGLWAMVGMATMMGATMRCPLTAILFTVEITRDFLSLPVVALGVTAALLVTVLWMKRSILTERLARRGHHIVTEYGVDPFELARVSEAMDKDPARVPSSMQLSELAGLIANGDAELSKRQATLVVDEKGLLTGIITRGDIMRALHNQASIDLTVGEAASREVAVTYPDETLNMALNKMLRKNIGRLAVVERGSPGKIVGYLGRASILAARLRFHQEEVLPDQERALLA